MIKQDYVKAILRYLRPVLWIDLIVAVVVGVITLLLQLYSLEAYGTLLVWAAVALGLIACIMGIGGLSSRMEDVGAFHLSGAGKMSENLRRIAEAGQSSLGCFTLLLAAGLSLLAIGYLLQFIASLSG